MLTEQVTSYELDHLQCTWLNEWHVVFISHLFNVALLGYSKQKYYINIYSWFASLQINLVNLN